MFSVVALLLHTLTNWVVEAFQFFSAISADLFPCCVYNSQPSRCEVIFTVVLNL